MTQHDSSVWQPTFLPNWSRSDSDLWPRRGNNTGVLATFCDSEQRYCKPPRRRPRCGGLHSTSDSERAAVLQQLESVVAVMAQCDWKRQYLIRGHEVVVVVRTINNNETTSAARCIDNAPLSISSVFITHNLHQGGVMQSLLFVCHSVSSITHKHVNRCRPNMVGVGNGWPSGSGYILGWSDRIGMWI